MEFIVRSPLNRPDTVEVRYDCECGCKPRARYQRDGAEAGHEHCCCGRVHFVGVQAEARLKEYLEGRRAQGLDADLTYSIGTEQAEAPWGEPVEVAFGIPDHLRGH